MRKNALVLFLLLFSLAFFMHIGALEASSLLASSVDVKPPDITADQGRWVGQYAAITCFVHDAKGNPVPGVTVYFTVDPLAKSVFQTCISGTDGIAIAEILAAKAGSAFVYAYYLLPGDNKYTVKTIAVTFFPAPKPSVTDDLLNTIQTFMARMTHSSRQGAIPAINGSGPGIPPTSGSGTSNPQTGGAVPDIPGTSGSGTLSPQTGGAGSAIPGSYDDDFAGLFTGTYAISVNTNSTNAYRPEAPAQNSQFSANVGVTDQGSNMVIDGYYKSVPIHLVSKVTRTMNTATCSLSFNLANKTVSGAGTLTFTMKQDGTPVVNGRGEGAYTRPYTPEKGADYHPGSGVVSGTRLSTALPNNTGNNQDGVGPVGDIPGPDNTDQAATGIIAPGLLTLVGAAAGSLPDLPFSSGGPDANLPDGDGSDGSGDGGGDDSSGGDGGGDSGDGGGASTPYLDPTTEAPPVDTSTQAPPQPPVPPDSGPTATPPAAAAPPVEPPPAQPPTPPGPLDGAEKVVHDNAGNDLNLVYIAAPTFTDGATGPGGWFYKDSLASFDEDAFNQQQKINEQYANATAGDAAKNATGADLQPTLDAIAKEQQDKLAQEKYLDNLGDKAMTSTSLSDGDKQKAWDAIQQQQSNIEDGLSVDSSKLKAITSLVKDAYSGKSADESTLPAAYDGMSTWNLIKDTTANTAGDVLQTTLDAGHAILTGKDRAGNISVMGIVARVGIDMATAGLAEELGFTEYTVLEGVAESAIKGANLAEMALAPAQALYNMNEKIQNAKPGQDPSFGKLVGMEINNVVIGEGVTRSIKFAGNELGNSLVSNSQLASDTLDKLESSLNNLAGAYPKLTPLAVNLTQTSAAKVSKAVIVNGIKSLFPK